MARFLQIILQAKEPQFSIVIKELETASSNRAVDLTYMSSILQRAHAVMRELTLDPADTTPKELIQALAANVGKKWLFSECLDVGIIIENTIISFHPKDIRQTKKHPHLPPCTTNVRQEIYNNLLQRYAGAAGLSTDSVAQKLAFAGLQDDSHNSEKEKK